MRDMGLDYEEIIERILPIRETGRIFFTIGSIDYLRHGGRIGNLRDSSRCTGDKTDDYIERRGNLQFRTCKKPHQIHEKVVEMTKDYLDETHAKPGEYSFCIGYGYDYEEAVKFREMLKDLVKERLGIEEIEIRQIGATIGVHTGPYPIGVGIIKKAE